MSIVSFFLPMVGSNGLLENELFFSSSGEVEDVFVSIWKTMMVGFGFFSGLLFGPVVVALSERVCCRQQLCDRGRKRLNFLIVSGLLCCGTGLGCAYGAGMERIYAVVPGAGLLLSTVAFGCVSLRDSVREQRARGREHLLG